MSDEELGTMTQRHTRARDSVASAHKDRGVLLAEVERLRGEVEQERVAVVTWLRDVGCRMAHGSEHEFVLLSVADAIENGEHRREEKP